VKTTTISEEIMTDQNVPILSTKISIQLPNFRLVVLINLAKLAQLMLFAASIFTCLVVCWAYIQLKFDIIVARLCGPHPHPLPPLCPHPPPLTTSVCVCWGFAGLSELRASGGFAAASKVGSVSSDNDSAETLGLFLVLFGVFSAAVLCAVYTSRRRTSKKAAAGAGAGATTSSVKVVIPIVGKLGEGNASVRFPRTKLRPIHFVHVRVPSRV